MKRLSVAFLAVAALLPFSLIGMEKEQRIEEKPIHIREVFMSGTDADEDKNADIIMRALRNGLPGLENYKSIAEIAKLLNTLNINIDSHVIIKDDLGEQIGNILICALGRCNPKKEEDVELVKLILQKVKTLEQQNLGLHPYLFYAIDKASKKNADYNLSIVKLLVDSGADVNFRFVNTKGHGNSALHRALNKYDGDATCINYLLAMEANTNVLDNVGLTPLAAFADRIKFIKENPIFLKFDLNKFELIIESLLNHGADIYATQTMYDNANQILVEINNYDLLKPLIPNLDTIIEKARKTLSDKKLAFDFANAVKNELKANRSIIIKGHKFTSNAIILNARCPQIFELNLD